MIPIRDSPRRKTNPIITKTLIFINVIVYLGAFFLGVSQITMIKSFGLIPLEITQQILMDTPLTIPAPYKLITSLFVHGGFFHLAGNMLFLWIFGDNVEDYLGKIKFLLLYLGGGIVASWIQIAFIPESTVPMVGASGAISCIMGAYLVLFPKARVDLMVFFFLPVVIPVPASFFLFFWFLSQLLQMLSGVPGIGWWAHIGGFGIGWLVARLFFNKKPPPPPYEIIYPYGPPE